MRNAGNLSDLFLVADEHQLSGKIDHQVKTLLILLLYQGKQSSLQVFPFPMAAFIRFLLPSKLCTNNHANLFLAVI